MPSQPASQSASQCLLLLAAKSGVVTSPTEGYAPFRPFVLRAPCSAASLRLVRAHHPYLYGFLPIRARRDPNPASGRTAYGPRVQVPVPPSYAISLSAVCAGAQFRLRGTVRDSGAQILLSADPADPVPDPASSSVPTILTARAAGRGIWCYSVEL